MKNNILYEGQRDRANGLSFFQRQDQSEETPPHFHRCIEIIYLTSGKLQCTIGEKSFTAEKDDILFMRPCAVHSLYADADYSDYVMICGQKYSEDFTNLLKAKSLPPLLNDKAFNRTILKWFDIPLPDGGLALDLVVKGYINLIMGTLLSHYETVPVPAAPQINMVVNVLNYIDEHYTEPLTLDQISSAFGYNKYYFSRLFNRYIGQNLNHYINSVRIRHLISAAQKAENPNLSELAFAVGFDSMTTFYRSFQMLYNCSPTELFKGGKQ